MRSLLTLILLRTVIFSICSSDILWLALLTLLRLDKETLMENPLKSPMIITGIII